MRPIYFVTYYDKGSTVMGADQISVALAARGVESRVVGPEAISAIADAVLVFIKTSDWRDLARAKRRRNRIVLDVQDTVVFKRRIKNAWFFDGVIFKNAPQLRDFGSDRRVDRVIYHQWDPRFRPNTREAGPLRVAYLGLRRSFPLWGRLAGVECFDREYFERGLNYNCHVSTRAPGREFLYKPNCKVSTAAACGANLVSTPDASTVELLGDDYPYYTADDVGSMEAAIDRARATFGGPVWRDGLDRMRRVRDRTSIDRICDDYVRYFEDIA